VNHHTAELSAPLPPPPNFVFPTPPDLLSEMICSNWNAYDHRAGIAPELPRDKVAFINYYGNVHKLVSAYRLGSG